jgi:hypothetical protein
MSPALPVYRSRAEPIPSPSETLTRADPFTKWLLGGSDHMHISRVMLLGATLALPVTAHAQSAPGLQQMLQGLFTGNQSQDDALRQAYQRGYQRGRDDEARALQANNRPAAMKAAMTPAHAMGIRTKTVDRSPSIQPGVFDAPEIAAQHVHRLICLHDFPDRGAGLGRAGDEAGTQRVAGEPHRIGARSVPRLRRSAAPPHALTLQHGPERWAVGDLGSSAGGSHAEPPPPRPPALLGASCCAGS